MARDGERRPVDGGTAGSGLAGLRVLVVEDEAILALALQDMLEALGCWVVGVAARVEAALELAQRSDFDLALLDVNLAGERVDPVARAVAARGLPLVFATGHEPGPALRALSGLVLDKPYDQEALGRTLQRALEEPPGPDTAGALVEPRSEPRSAAPPASEEPPPAAPEREAWLDLALEAGGMGCWEWRIETGRVTWSNGLEAIHGLAPGSFGGRFADFESDIHPDDREAVLATIERTLEQGADHRIEYRIRRPDGCVRWVEGRGRLLRDASGRAVRMVGVCTDVTERKQNEECQRLLLDELNHRLNNTLAIVQSLAHHTLKDAPDPSAFQDRFTARLSALSAAHSLLTRELWKGAVVTEILAAVLAPFGSERADAIALEGPRVLVDANAAVTLCLIFHELASEAARQGALCRPDGRLRVSWSRAPQRLELFWRESGWRPAGPPKGRGYGARLVAMGAAQLGGEAATRYHGEGLEVQLRLPLGRVDGDAPPA